jgi:hypothetical protein
MSSSVFRIKEHTLECQHVREYPRATARAQEDVLYLAIKQYKPLDNPHPREGDLTIIGAHANGFPKVLLPKHLKGTRSNTLIQGNVRALLGGPPCLFQKKWLSNTQHLDCRRGTPRG